MRIIQVGKKYESKIYVLDDKKLIYKLNCECADFKFRRIKKVGELSGIKYYSEPCKHLKSFVKILEKKGYELKKPKEMTGEDKLSPKLREKLMERANYACECGCEGTDALEVHRKIRKSEGGKYNELNCIVLTKDHHKLRHANEFAWSKSK